MVSGDDEHRGDHDRHVALEDALTISRPTPGQAKIDSVTTAPPIKRPSCRPMRLTTGLMALGRTCSHTRAPAPRRGRAP